MARLARVTRYPPVPPVFAGSPGLAFGSPEDDRRKMQSLPMTSLRLTGPLTGLGAAFAAFAFCADQVFKWWMLGPFDIAARQPVRITPFLDLVLAWNKGVSYGWLEQHTAAGRWGLIALGVVASIWLWLWLAQTTRPLTAAALGLVIGGALGNVLDRVVHHAVADFFLAHAWGYSWYVFNLADTAIVAGIVVLLYETRGQGRDAAR